jgi:hypothetical protein
MVERLLVPDIITDDTVLAFTYQCVYAYFPGAFISVPYLRTPAQIESMMKMRPAGLSSG